MPSEEKMTIDERRKYLRPMHDRRRERQSVIVLRVEAGNLCGPHQVRHCVPPHIPARAQARP
jgi:hypothetical protein